MKKLIQLSLLFIISTGYAQESLKEANKLFELNSFADAAKMYQQYLSDTDYKNIKPQIWLKIADTNYKLKNHQQAQIAYKNSFEQLRYDMGSEHIWQYFDVLRFLKKYDEADHLYVNYLKLSKKDKELNRYYEEKSRFNEIINNDTLYDVKNLNINSSYADFGGSLYKNKFIFSSARNEENAKIYKRNNTPYLSLYQSDTITATSFKNVSLFSQSLETKYHDATATFYNDNKTMIYSSSAQSGNRKIYSKNKRNFFKLYRVQLNKDKFEKEELPINGKGYSIGQPFVNTNGTQLYFVSDMPGGYGKADIYVCDIREDGTFSTPRNLGDAINTPYDDFFPYLYGNTLYFSSKGHVGFGGLDIYKAQLNDGLYTNARNLGFGINSNADDFAYVQGQENNRGYFSSNRQGGKGDDDIYSFIYDLKECYQYIEGTVVDSQIGAPITNTKITVYDNNRQIIAETITDALGKYSVKMGCDTRYYFEASKIGYSKDGLDLDTGTEPNEIIKFVDFKLQNLSDIFVTDNGIEKIKINPINFESNRFTINLFAAQQLKRVIDIMNEYPLLVIKIESHTDQRGGASYNQTLSENRAKATRDHLIKNGIDYNRIESAKGFGESQPINICDEEGTNCTDLQFLENRRSNFIVVKR